MKKYSTIAMVGLLLFCSACDKNRKAAKKKAKADAIKVSKKRSSDFHLKMKSESGVITLPSGLQYKVIESGKGATPKASDKVSCHYEGRLIDGTVFDSSYKRGKAIEFSVTGVISGWTEALQLMKVGDKWELYIPYQLAYGERGAGAVIAPCSSLIFTIELIEITQTSSNLDGSEKPTVIDKK